MLHGHPFHCVRPSLQHCYMYVAGRSDEGDGEEGHSDNFFQRGEYCTFGVCVCVCVCVCV